MKCLPALVLSLHLVAAHGNTVAIQPGDQPGLACPSEAYRSQRKLAETPTQRPSTRVASQALRMAIWGDSHTANRSFTEALVSTLSLDPTQVQPSFLTANWSLKGIAHPLQGVCASHSWRHHIPAGRDADTGSGLSSMSSEKADSLLTFDFRWPTASTRLSSARLHLGKLDGTRTLVLALSADGGPEFMIALPGAIEQPLQLNFARPVATLHLRLVAGQVTIHGLSPAYAEPRQHQLDVFSTPGATMAGWDRASIRSRVFTASLPEIDLGILQYGTNDAPDVSGRLEDYLAALRSGLRQFRSVYPTARCVLVGPPDRGGQARIVSHSVLHSQVSRAQQLAAAEHGCSFWDWQAHMGGIGSAAAGARRVPAFVQPDLVHLTPEGYRESGQAFGIWLMQRKLWPPANPSSQDRRS